MEETVAGVEAFLVGIAQNLLEEFGSDVLSINKPEPQYDKEQVKVSLVVNRLRDMAELDWGYHITVNLSRPSNIRSQKSEIVCSGHLNRSTGATISSLTAFAAPISANSILPDTLESFLNDMNDSLVARLRFDIGLSDSQRIAQIQSRCIGHWRFSNTAEIVDLNIENILTSFVSNRRDDTVEMGEPEFFRTQFIRMGNALVFVSQPKYVITYVDDTSLEFGVIDNQLGQRWFQWSKTFTRL
jgi:hypothetical protein